MFVAIRDGESMEACIASVSWASPDYLLSTSLGMFKCDEINHHYGLRPRRRSQGNGVKIDVSLKYGD